jgi:hypothetical protein
MRRTRPVRRKLQKKRKVNDVTCEREKISSILFPAIILTDARDASEELFARDHRIAEYHEETTNYGKIAEEKGHVKNEAIAEPLNDDNCEKSRDGIFCMTLRHDGAGGNKHGLCKQREGCQVTSNIHDGGLTMTFIMRNK